jgi:hypothetical protein
VVAGSYWQQAGSIQLKFGGPQWGNDSFQVQAEGFLLGNVTVVGGTLQVTLVDGFSPSSGAEFNVFTWAGDLTGTFANSVLIGPGGNIAHQTKYNANSVSFVMP